MYSGSRVSPKIILVISSLFHARSVFETSVIESLEENFDIIIVCTKEVFEIYNESIQNRDHYLFKINTEAENFSNRVMNAGAFRFKSKSTSFEYRINRRIRESTRFKKECNSIILADKLSWIIIWSKLFIDGWLLYWTYLIPKYRKSLDSNLSLLSVFKEVEPDLVVIWSQSMEPSSSAAVRFSRKLEIPSILIADNWDNLFSKTVLVEKPDLVGCFGMQGVNFGAKLHDIPPKNIVPLGSARFEIYRGREIDLKQRDTVLYVGSSIVAEDERVLKCFLKVKKQIDQMNILGSSLIWKYRPHPFPQKSVTELPRVLQDFQDLQIENTREGDASSLTWPKLKESVAELSRTRVAVSMPTSYLLEVRINSIEVIIPAFKDNSELNSCKTLLSSLEHLKGLDTLSGVTIAKSEAELESILLNEIMSPHFQPPDRTLDWFVQWSGEGFGRNLTEAVQRLLK